MASHMICVLLCIVCSVHSAWITGTIKKTRIERPNEVEVTEHINGEDFDKVLELTLNRLTHGSGLPALTLTNFKSLRMLRIINITLEQVPVFVNTSIEYMFIRANKITSVPAHAFDVPRPHFINLMENKIVNIADNAFNAGVTELILRCNKLSTVSLAWFQDPSILEVLDLAGNRIKSIQNHAFKQMTKLNDLSLSYNHMKRIGSESFNSGIKKIELQFNDIEQLTMDMFARPRLPMHFLHLHYNKLSFLPEALFLELHPAFITLHGNPWQCQCWRDIERWIRERNTTEQYFPLPSKEPVCVMPVNFKSECVPIVDRELQAIYAQGLSPVYRCLATACNNCSASERKNYYI